MSSNWNNEVIQRAQTDIWYNALQLIWVKTMERLYGEDKKKALSDFYDGFCEEIDQLFFNKFQELSDLNVGEGETTRIVGRLLNAKTNVIDQIKGWLLWTSKRQKFIAQLQNQSDWTVQREKLKYDQQCRNNC